MNGRVLELRIKDSTQGMVRRERLDLVDGRGIEDDAYFDDTGRTLRQVLLLDKSTLEDFGYSPGTLREQILVDLPQLQTLPPATRLQVGEAEVEITMDCAPCRTMAGYVGEDGQAFVNKMMGRRGMLGKVVRSGVVNEGDEISVIQ
jgi:hypothetical protein